jgi:uncharacterized membrane protein
LEWQRWPSVLAGAIAPAVLFVAARRLGLSAWAAVVAAAVAVSSQWLWLMSLEVRAYAPTAALTAVALALAAGVVRRGGVPSWRSIATLAALHLAMISLHFFAAFAVCGISLAVAMLAPAATPLRRRIGVATALGAPAAVAMLTWLALAYSSFNGMQGRNIAWIPELGLGEALRGVVNVTLARMGAQGTLISAALLAAALTAAAWRLRRPSKAPGDGRRAATFTLVAGVLPVALALLAHLLRDERLLVARYLTVFVPGLALLVAVAIDTVPARARRVVALSGIAWWMVSGTLQFAERRPKPDWSGIVSALAPDGHATLCATGRIVGLPLLMTTHRLGADGVQVVNSARCADGRQWAWVVYDADRGADFSAFASGDVALGTRVVLSRGVQNIDARRIVRRAAAR